MSPYDARRIVDALARGIDPETGEVLPDDHLLQFPHVIRALFMASRALEALEGKGGGSREANERLPNTGVAWTAAEEARLLAAFDAGATVDELAQSHGRTKGGIAARLVRLGRISERSEVAKRAD
ncbi:MAG TPA: hypothetical protein VFL86_14955 [Burkholderiaceae bacterium]|nr:hypothetical protein [Burkholderiaceae bacterium]